MYITEILQLFYNNITFILNILLVSILTWYYKYEKLYVYGGEDERASK